MTTKKSVKLALKGLLAAEKMNCPKCRDEVRAILSDLGIAMRNGSALSMAIKTEDNHVIYKIGVADHKVPEPVAEKGEAAVAEKDEE